MKEILIIAASLLVTLFVACIFGAFIEGNIDFATWGEKTKNGIVGVTLVVNFLLFIGRHTELR